MAGFKKPSAVSGSGGGFFDPKKYPTAIALLIEPKRLFKDVDNTYQGETKKRDELSADVTVFGNLESLEGGKPTEVMSGVRLVHKALVNTASEYIGEEVPAMPALVRKAPGKNYYAFQDLSEDVEAKVAEYYEQREAALSAAVEDAPDF